jgi:hypothetical protein
VDKECYQEKTLYMIIEEENSTCSIDGCGFGGEKYSLIDDIFTKCGNGSGKGRGLTDWQGYGSGNGLGLLEDDGDGYGTS